MVMVPAGLIWKLGVFKASGFSPWLTEGLKMGTEWGAFSASYSGADAFFANIRGVDDKYNSYIACGVCSAASRFKEGFPAMAQGFATGFAFVYVLEQLTGSMGENSEVNPNKSTIEGAIGRNRFSKSRPKAAPKGRAVPPKGRPYKMSK
jgi:hypothetical protein